MPSPINSPFARVTALAGLRPVHGAFAWLHGNPKRIMDWQAELVAIPGPPFGEQARSAWMAGRFSDAGLHRVSVDEIGNVLGFLPAANLAPESTGPIVVLSAHLDTVFPAETPLNPVVEGDRLEAPGACDNGAGLSGLLAIAYALVQAGVELPASLLFLANVGEEGEGDLCGIRHICRQPELLRRIHSFLVLDGAATDHITIQGLGSRRFEIAFSGAGGHSWSDFGIGNPVHALSRAVALFVDQRPVDPRSTPKVSLNVGIIEGGASINAIPPSARAKVDIRSESDEKIDQLVTLLQHSVTRAEEIENMRAIGSKVSARVREIGSRPAARLAGDAPIVARIRSVDAHLGIRSRLDCASTDANIPLSMGVPAVCIGAGGQGGGAHTAAEWYRSAGRDLGLKRILLAAALLLQDSASE
jgi:tripeptide aminopeptidase